MRDQRVTRAAIQQQRQNDDAGEKAELFFHSLKPQRSANFLIILVGQVFFFLKCTFSKKFCFVVTCYF
jgi:hypothetical protein